MPQAFEDALGQEDAGTQVVEFSPTADLERTLEVVLRNVEAAKTQS